MSSEEADPFAEHRFGDLVKITNGQVSPLDDRYADRLHIGPENIESGTGRIYGLKTARELGLKSGKYRFDKDCIIYSKIRPNLNKVCTPTFSGICSADAYPLRVREGLNKEFIAHLMRSPIFVRQATARSMRTGLPKINRPDLEDIRVLIPDLSLQRKISDILSTWEKSSDSIQRLLLRKEERKRSLTRLLLSGEKRLPGFTADWQEVRLDQVATNSSLRNIGSVPDDRLYAVTKANGLIPMREHVKGISTERCRVVKHDWFAYNPMRLNIGSIARLHEEEPAMVSPDYVVFYCHEDRLDPDFLDHLRRSRRWQHFVNVAGNGSVRVRIYFKDLGSFKFHLPPIEEQRRIAEILNTCDREITLHRRQLEAIREQKRGLMQKLLTGEVRVKI